VIAHVGLGQIQVVDGTDVRNGLGLDWNSASPSAVVVDIQLGTANLRWTMPDTAATAYRQINRSHVLTRVVVGLVYVVSGVLVLLAQIADVTLAWSIVVPAAVVVLGVGLLVTGIVDTRMHGQGYRP
jgi:hypothetical protein